MSDLFGTMFPGSDDPDYWRRLGEILGHNNDGRIRLVTEPTNPGVFSIGIGVVPFKSAFGIGKHAGESIAARSPARDFTVAERAQINRIGAATGCHTCGTTNPGTRSGNVILDHQPPSSPNPPGGPQRLYPHCVTCSRQQGLGIARKLLQGTR